MKLGTILLIAVIAAAVAGLILFLGYLGYNSPLPFNDWYLTISGYIGNFDLSALISNPAMILTALGGVATVAIPLYTQLNSAKQQIAQVTKESTEAIGDLTGKNKELQAKIDSLTTENSTLNGYQQKTEQTISELQSKLGSAEQSLTKVTAAKDELQTQLNTLQTIQQSPVIQNALKTVVK